MEFLPIKRRFTHPERLRDTEAAGSREGKGKNIDTKKMDH